MSTQSSVPALLNSVGITSVQPEDEFTIVYKNGLFEATVKRESGKVETIRQTVNSKGFNQMTNFDPKSMQEVDRNKLISQLYNNGRGESQTAIGRKFGLEQSQISRIIKKVK